MNRTHRYTDVSMIYILVQAKFSQNVLKTKTQKWSLVLVRPLL